MIEAKGVTAFVNRQFRSKVNRMRVIFDTTASWYRPDVVPHVVLASRAMTLSDANRARAANVPQDGALVPRMGVLKDGKPRWVRLHLESDLRRIERWDEATSKPAKLAATWHVRDTTASSLTA
jgi:hypothetical protein